MQADFNEIYNLLFAGKSIRLEFTTAKEAEYFRVRFATFKIRQEKALLDIGAVEPSDILSFSFTKEKNSSTYVAKLIARRPLTTFKILGVD
jgi:hypothetical protein